MYQQAFLLPDPTLWVGKRPSPFRRATREKPTMFVIKQNESCCAVRDRAMYPKIQSQEVPNLAPPSVEVCILPYVLSKSILGPQWAKPCDKTQHRISAEGRAAGADRWWCRYFHIKLSRPYTHHPRKLKIPVTSIIMISAPNFFPCAPGCVVSVPGFSSEMLKT